MLDKRLTTPLSLITDMQTLRENGVAKIVPLSTRAPPADIECVMYFVRADASLMQVIAEHVRARPDLNWNIVFVPRRPLLCDKLLEMLDVLKDVQIHSFQLDLIPFDDDVLSMDLDDAYRAVMLDREFSTLYDLARGLSRLETLYGRFSVVRGKGMAAEFVANALGRLRREIAASASSFPTPAIYDEVILIDRSVDLITPMMTQLTYEGLVNEVFGIKCTVLEIDSELAGVKKEERKTVKINLTSSDAVFGEIRDMNFSALGPFLNKKAKFIDAELKKRHDARTVEQIRDFVANFGSLNQQQTSLRVHINVAEKVNEFTQSAPFLARLSVEQAVVHQQDIQNALDLARRLLMKGERMIDVLRVACLASVVAGGLKQVDYRNLTRELVHAYGYEFLLSVVNLRSAGLLRSNERSPPVDYSRLRNTFTLLNHDVNEAEPDDIAYAYSGYAPLSVRAVYAMMRHRNEDVLRQMAGGPLFGTDQPATNGLNKLVVFIGGVTHAEVSALRWLGQNKGMRFSVATTKVINTATFITPILEHIANSTNTFLQPETLDAPLPTTGAATAGTAHP